MWYVLVELAYADFQKIFKNRFGCKDFYNVRKILYVLTTKWICPIHAEPVQLILRSNRVLDYSHFQWEYFLQMFCWSCIQDKRFDPLFSGNPIEDFPFKIWLRDWQFLCWVVVCQLFLYCKSHHTFEQWVCCTSPYKSLAYMGLSEWAV